MPKKPRCASCSTGWCKNHVIQLNPLTSNLYYRKNFKIRLCPRLNKQNNAFQKTLPLFNKDKKFYTPSFYLDEEKKYYRENDERVLRNHNLKILEDINQNQTIWVPRHARKRNYCFVCKIDYNDYLEHLIDPLHKKCLRNNCFTSFILEIEEKFAQQHKTENQQKKQDDLKRWTPTQQSSSISESTSKSIDFIRKLMKRNEQHSEQHNKQPNEQHNEQLLSEVDNKIIDQN